MNLPKPTGSLPGVLLASAFALLAHPAFADGTRLPDQDDFVVARGDANVATADRPSDVYYNAAGLSQIDTIDFSSGFYVLTPSVSYSRQGGPSVSETQTTYPLPSFFIAEPVTAMNGEHLTVGLGLYSPYGLSSKWPDSTGFRTLATENSIEYYTGSFAVGVPLAPGLSLGAALQFNHQHVDLNRGLGYTPTDRFHFAGDGHALSYDLGLLWTPVPEHSFGLNFQSKTNFGINGTANLDPLGVSFTGHADWVYPEDITVGYSYRPTPDWNVEFDVDRTNWSRLKNVVLYSPSFAPTVIPFNWRASEYFNLGATHYWRSGWSLSGGIERSTSSVPVASFAPSLVDPTRWLWSAGGSYKWGRVEFDFLLQLSPKEEVDISGTASSPAGQNANGQYFAHLWAFGVGTRYRF